MWSRFSWSTAPSVTAPAKSKSGLDLSSLATLLRGGDRGAAVLPGRPDDSLLILSLAAGADPHMPPKGQLTEEQVGLLKTWVSRLGTNTAPASVESTAAPVPTAPRTPSWIPPESWTPVQVINRWIELGWKERQVQPARPASDATFVRRIHLDLAGRVPTPGEVERFEKDRRSDKRERLIDELLAGSEYPRHFAEVLDTVLMGRRGPEWEGKRKKNQWFSYLERAFRENRPWDQLVRELILARPPSPEELGSVWYLYERKSNPQAMAEAVAPVVFGLQIKCAQCHDHLVAREIKQAHYWGLVAAFNRSKSVETPAGPGVAESAIGGFVSFANLKKESQPARLVLFHGATIEEAWPQDGEKEMDASEKYLVPPPAEKQPVQAPAVPKFSRRAALADAVTRDNPLLARALVNRVWALMLGRGLVHPVDLMDSKHPPSHPELLDWLAEDFARSGYDVKRLVRTLALTRAYQLDSRPHRGRTVPPESFARALEKPLSAEQYFRSFVEVIGPPEATAALADPVRQAFLRQFPDLFAAEYNATLQQALFLSNSPLVDGLLEPEGGNLTAQLSQIEAPRDRARAAIRIVLGRDPERDELAEATAYLASRPAESGHQTIALGLAHQRGVPDQPLTPDDSPGNGEPTARLPLRTAGPPVASPEVSHRPVGGRRGVRGELGRSLLRAGFRAVGEEAGQALHSAVVVWGAQSVRNLGSQAGSDFRRTLPGDSHETARRAVRRIDAAHGGYGRPDCGGSVDEDQPERTPSGHRSVEPRRCSSTALCASHSGSRPGATTGATRQPDSQFHSAGSVSGGNEFKEFKSGNWAGWLGAQYGPVRVGGDYKIEDVRRLADLTTDDQEARNALRRFFNRKFENERKSAAAASQNAVFERVKGLMSCAHLFDLEKLPASDREKYGPGAFGLHALQARHLVENGAPFVMVANGMPWDSHVFHNEIYQMLVPELDRVIFHLLNDLRERGLLDDTLVVMMGEFGRTPWMNQARGRDHYPNAWSLALAGCGIRRGVVVGETDADGVDVVGTAFNEKNLFATLFSALGLDPYAEYDLPELPSFHRVEDRAEPIRAVLA